MQPALEAAETRAGGEAGGRNQKIAVDQWIVADARRSNRRGLRRIGFARGAEVLDNLGLHRFREGCVVTAQSRLVGLQ